MYKVPWKVVYDANNNSARLNLLFFNILAFNLLRFLFFHVMFLNWELIYIKTNEHHRIIKIYRLYLVSSNPFISTGKYHK